MQPPTFGIHHLALVVSDLEAMERFYVGVLGLPLVKRWGNPDNTRQRSVWLALGHDAFLALERADSRSSGSEVRATRGEGHDDDSRLEQESIPSSVRTPITQTPCCFGPNAGWHLVALTINPSDREAWRRRLSDAGHPIERETDCTMYARDPERNFIALSHWPQR
ncbi:MAG TPA: VOC family protein [Polyangiaceae bacterium]|nr:VOC family protein [Polyangiaceae bacterium]